jgi:hypothetical protein
VGATFVALGKALVDAIAVRLVGDDEDAGVGGSGLSAKQEHASQER